MYQPLIALAVFGGLVWMISEAIFMLLHNDGDAEISPLRRDTMTAFVEENYGVRFESANPLGEEGMRRL
ncbi:MAG: hypothetical protein K8S22_13365 [Betaproteobacteria bacterium]|nr:hypothetical protein [Betaproteobacteria bacterium]